MLSQTNPLSCKIIPEAFYKQDFPGNLKLLTFAYDRYIASKILVLIFLLLENTEENQLML